MRRAFWIAVGLGAGATAAIIVSRWARKQSERMAPANLARQATEAARDFGTLLSEVVEEFRRGMTEKETEVRRAIGA